MLDWKIFKFINLLPHNWFLDQLAVVIHLITREGLIYYPLFLVLFFSKNKIKINLAKYGLIAGLVTFVVNDLILKNIFQRLRPFELFQDINFIAPAPASYSFPSGQAAVAFAVATMVWLFFPRRVASYTGLFLAVVVGISRIYMGQHFPSDVLFGALIGTATSVVVYKLKK